MKKRSMSSSTGRGSKAGMILGRERFAKISAVEGIVLTADMRKRAARAEQRGLSGEERRLEIARSYRKG